MREKEREKSVGMMLWANVGVIRRRAEVRGGDVALMWRGRVIRCETKDDVRTPVLRVHDVETD